jgi:hypothetical protein
MLSVANKSIMLNVYMLSVIMLNVCRLNVCMLSVIMLSVVMLSAVEPNRGHIHNPLYSSLLTNGLN